MKIEICMWNVWNLKFWELKCLNWDVWILKAENWKLKFEISMWSISNLKIEMSEFGCANTESWKLKTEIWNLFVKSMEAKLKTKMLNTEN